MDTKTPVNIRLSADADEFTPKKDPEKNGATYAYENFLITTNNHYRKQINELQTRLHEIEREKDEIETDNEKIETSQRYMRGILKNYYEIDQYNIKLKEELEQLISKSSISTFVIKIVSVMIVCCAIALATTETWYYVLPPILLAGGMYTKIYDYIVLKQTSKLKELMTQTNLEISTIKKTNELLPDLFDNL